MRPLLLGLPVMALMLGACGDDASRGLPGRGGAGVRSDDGAKRPHLKLDPAKIFDVALDTSCGEFTIRLDQKTSPKTAASFASLTRSGFYDGTLFQRIVPDFVIQGGDPTATGSGGPRLLHARRAATGHRLLRGAGRGGCDRPTGRPSQRRSRYPAAARCDREREAHGRLIARIARFEPWPSR